MSGLEGPCSIQLSYGSSSILSRQTAQKAYHIPLICHSTQSLTRRHQIGRHPNERTRSAYTASAESARHSTKSSLRSIVTPNMFGTPSRIRTCGLQFRKLLLCPAELPGLCMLEDGRPGLACSPRDSTRSASFPSTVLRPRVSCVGRRLPPRPPCQICHWYHWRVRRTLCSATGL